MERIRIHGVLTAAGMAALAVLAVPAAAQDAAKDTYLRYHQAISVVEKCDERVFNQNEYSSMEAYIDKQINNQLGAGERLHLIEQGKTNAYDLVTKWGCDSDKVGEYLELFERELQLVI